MPTSCALTGGYTLGCRDGVGGAIEVYFIEKGNVTTITEVSGVITGITKTAGSVFRKYEQEEGVMFFTETLNSNVQNQSTFYLHELTIVVNKMDTTMRNELLLLNKNRLYAVVKDANGLYWLLGKTRALKATAGNGGTGTASGDRNGFTFTYSGPEPELAPALDSATVTSLLVAG